MFYPSPMEHDPQPIAVSVSIALVQLAQVHDREVIERNKRRAFKGLPPVPTLHDALVREGIIPPAAVRSSK